VHALTELVRSKEDWLIERVLIAARHHGYARYTSTLMEAWRASIQGLSDALIQSLATSPAKFDFSPEYDPVQDPIAYFGIIEAQRHRARGVTLEQYLGLLKYYRQAYYDLFATRGLGATIAREGRRGIERFFDRLEFGVCSEWARVPHDGFVEDLRRVNRAMTNEKNRLLTIIESLPLPVLYIDASGMLQLFNRAAAELLEVGHDDGGGTWMNAELERIVRDMLKDVKVGNAVSQTCLVQTRHGERPLLVKAAPMLDVSSKFSGTVISLIDPPAPGGGAELPMMNQHVEPSAAPQTTFTKQRFESASTTAANQKFKELMLLYRVSNTMLTTVRLNKLIHLILTALTAGENPFFDRAILFLTNDRSGFMQGMLGVTRETSVVMAGMVTDPADVLGSSWDLSEEVMLRQQESEFTRLVRGSRLELDKRQNISSRAALEKRLIFVRDISKEKRADTALAEKLGITSFAVAPLIAKEKVFGIVLVDNAMSGRRIQQSDLGFLQIFTNQAGVAIENALLYTRLEEANRSLREAQERLIHGERLATIGEMAASLAHELKGPLVSIGGFAKRLLRGLPEAGAQHDSAEMITKEVLRLEKLLGDILSFGRKTTLCYDQWHVQEMVEESLAVVAPSCAEQQITVQRKFPVKPLQIIADGQQLKQVFLNLFFNAQEAMIGKGRPGILAVSIAPSRLRGCPAVTIKVADSGGGVPESQLHNIFTAFYTTKEAGTGLGLPIAHRIVTNHRGTIQVHNIPDKGLEFTITLPQQP
jgi:signal transduction histidine kinase/PAS domain-containing protein